MENLIVKGWARENDQPSQIRSTAHRLEVLATVDPASDAADVVVQVNGADISPANPLPVDQAPPAAVYAGQTVVAASGTEVPLTTTQALQSGVTVKALSTNTNNVAVGPNPVTMTTGILLAAGEWAFIEVDDLAKVYVDATTNGEGVSWIGS